MKYLIALILICCLLVSGCVPSVDLSVSPSAEGSTLPSADIPILSPELTTESAATSSATPELPSEPGLMLSKLCDPLGFFADPEVYTLPVEEIAVKYGAVYETVPDLYEIPNITVGGSDARLFIQTKDGKVEQVLTTLNASLGYLFETPEGSPNNEDVYQTLIDTLGEPDRYYDYYEEKEIGAEDFPDVTNHTAAQWKHDGRTYEFGYVGRGADGERPHYIAVYREKLSMWEFHYYARPSDCCPHEDMGAYFDPTGIFMDKALFTDDAETVLSHYSARPAYESESSREFVGDLSWPYVYVIDGFAAGGHSAKLNFGSNLQTSEYGWEATYCIDLLGQKAETVYAFVNEVISQIAAVPGMQFRYSSKAADTNIEIDAVKLPLSYFDEGEPDDDKYFSYHFGLAQGNQAYGVTINYYRKSTYISSRGDPQDEHTVPAIHTLKISVHH